MSNIISQIINSFSLLSISFLYGLFFFCSQTVSFFCYCFFLRFHESRLDVKSNFFFQAWKWSFILEQKKNVIKSKKNSEISSLRKLIFLSVSFKLVTKKNWQTYFTRQLRLIAQIVMLIESAFWKKKHFFQGKSSNYYQIQLVWGIDYSNR